MLRRHDPHAVSVPNARTGAGKAYRAWLRVAAAHASLCSHQWADGGGDAHPGADARLSRHRQDPEGHTDPRGVTRPMRVTLSDGTLTHDAAFSSVDERRSIERFPSGRVEFDFVDSYTYT